jgi:hypothetical protein
MCILEKLMIGLGLAVSLGVATAGVLMAMAIVA